MVGKGVREVLHHEGEDVRVEVAVLDDSKRLESVTVTVGTTQLELLAPSAIQANNWGLAIEKYTGCTAVGKDRALRWNTTMMPPRKYADRFDEACAKTGIIGTIPGLVCIVFLFKFWLANNTHVDMRTGSGSGSLFQ